MITRLRVRGYKSLRDVELRDLSQLVVLFGPNAAGKSNLLDALDLIAHLVKEDTLAAAFQRHRGNRAEHPLPIRWFFHSGGGGASDRGGQDLTMGFEMDLELQPSLVDSTNRELAEREEHTGLERPYTRVTQSRLRYELEIRYSPEARALYVNHESLAPLTKGGQPNESIIPYIRHDASAKRFSVKLERQAHPRYYEIRRSRTLLSEIADLVNHPHLVTAARELRSVRVYYVEPIRMRSAIADIEATDPGPHGEQLAAFYHWLYRKHGISFRNLVHNLGRLIPGIVDLEVREGAEGFLELWVTETEEAEFPAALVSEGTLRVLCLLGIAATPRSPAVVGYEEPENGVSPARLSEMLSILDNASQEPAEAQLILTTHSPAVVDFFDRGTRILCQRSDLGSSYEVIDLPQMLRQQVADGSLASSRATNVGARFARGDLD